MEEQHTRYHRLARPTASLVSRHGLWIAPDHLLSVTSTGFTEGYKRFYFKDIQAIVVRETSLWRVMDWILGALAILFLVLTALGGALGWSLGPVVADLVACLAFSVALLLSLMSGPTCVCELRTAVQVEHLRCLNRMRKTLRVVDRLRLEIETVQGALAPEDAERACLSAQADNPLPSWGDAQPLPSRPRRQFARQLKPYRSRAHDVLTIALLADMLHTIADVAARSYAVHMAGMAIGMGLIVSTVMAVIKQQGTRLPQGLKNVAWGTLAYLVVSFVFWTGYNMMLSVKWQDTSIGYLGVQHYVAVVPLGTTPVLAAWLSLCTFTAGALALSGLVLMQRYRRNQAEPSSQPQDSPTTPASADGGETESS